jgi:short-subunit dehydrogenase
MPLNPRKRAVITGASSGIGAALARELARQGWSLVLAARRVDRLDSLAAELQRGGSPAAHAVACDVLEQQQIAHLARRARELLGEVDVWINNAGAGLRHRLLEATEEQMLWQFRLNCLSALWGYQAVIPGWLDSGHPGQVIDICSLGGKSGYAYNGAYSAAKHGMSALGDTLRFELAASTVAISTVYPGPTVSDFGENCLDLSGGRAAAEVERARSGKSSLSRSISAKQETAAVVRSVLAAIASRRPCVYPHRGANLGVLLNNLLPGLTLSLYRRTQRPVRPA